MRIVISLCVVLVATAVLSPQAAQAGMPSSFTALSDMARMRFQTMSFFLLGLLVCTWAVRSLWNYLQRDFTRLPRLTFGKAAVLVLLWGLLSIVVLTMISGARELMTPGAWKTQGATYRLVTQTEKSGEQAFQEDLIATRRRHLEQLRTVLSNFAGKHDGKFPPSLFESSISPQERQLPISEGMPYSYVPGQTVGKSGAVLVFEPRIYGNDQFVLLANGEILRMSPEKLRRSLETHNAKPSGPATARAEAQKTP